MSADRSGSNVSIGNSGSWNKYSYTIGDPVNGSDPSGLCDVVMGGITPNSANFADVEEYAAADGAISVYPYSANSNNTSVINKLGNVLAGVAEVAYQRFAPQSGTYAAVIGLLLAAQDGEPINVTTFSGGAAAFTAAVAFLNSQGSTGQAVTAMINSITYVAPGGASQLYNNGNLSVIGGGTLNNLVGWAASISGPFTYYQDTNNCGHSFGCLVQEFPGAITNGDQCSKPYVVNSPPRSFFAPVYNPMFGNYSLFNSSNISAGSLPFVTSRLLPN